jgi:hypothetical protein
LLLHCTPISSLHYTCYTPALLLLSFCCLLLLLLLLILLLQR